MSQVDFMLKLLQKNILSGAAQILFRKLYRINVKSTSEITFSQLPMCECNDCNVLSNQVIYIQRSYAMSARRYETSTFHRP